MPNERSTDDLLAAVLVDAPDVLAPLRAAWEAAWAVVDPMLLEGCRLLVASILGCEPELEVRTPVAIAAGFTEAHGRGMSEWYRSPLWDERARACFAFTEQFVIDVANLDDDAVGRVRGHLGDTGLLDFANAILVVEQRQRLRLVWGRVLEPAA